MTRNRAIGVAAVLLATGGCASPIPEDAVPRCIDGLDNDQDGRADCNDEGCCGLVLCDPRTTCGGASVDAGGIDATTPDAGHDPGVLGAACSIDDDCASGACSDGVCCDSVCAGSCDVCRASLGAARDGACTIAAEGSHGEPACDGGSCDGVSAQCVSYCADAIVEREPSRPIDVVIAIDNSVSVSAEAAVLEEQLNPSFAAPLAAAGVDYRVIMVTGHGALATDVCVPPTLSSTTDCSGPPGENARFAHYSVDVQSLDAPCILLDTFHGAAEGGEADEFGQHFGGWGPLLRAGSRVAMVVVTDDRAVCAVDGTPYEDSFDGTSAAAGVDAALRSLSPEHFGTLEDRNYRFYSIVGLLESAPGAPHLPDDPIVNDVCSSGGYNPGRAYQWLSRNSGGLRFAECDASVYDRVLLSIADDIASSFSEPCRYAVPDPPAGTPDLETLVVTRGEVAGDVRVDPVRDLDACGEEGDEFYRVGEVVYLCPTACRAVLAADADVRVAYHCN